MAAPIASQLLLIRWSDPSSAPNENQCERIRNGVKAVGHTHTHTHTHTQTQNYNNNNKKKKKKEYGMDDGQNANGNRRPRCPAISLCDRLKRPPPPLPLPPPSPLPPPPLHHFLSLAAFRSVQSRRTLDPFRFNPTQSITRKQQQR